MRLIDADALRNKMFFSEGLRENGILYVPFGEVVKNINDAPTAYNVEKVVAELEEEREYAYADFEEYAESYGLDLSEHDDWYYQGLKRAITLAKRGIVK